MQPHAHIQAVIEILAEAEELARPVDRVMSFYFRGNRYIGSKDKKAIAERVYKTLRNQGMVDWCLEEAKIPLTARTRVATQMVLDGDDLKTIFTGEQYAPKKLSGAERHVLDIHSKTSKAPVYAQLNYPKWVSPMLKKAFPEDLEEAMTALNKPAPTDIRLNLLKGTPKDILKALTAEGIASNSETPLSAVGARLTDAGNLFGMKAFRDGLFEVQDAGSQIIGALCGVKPGMKVTDYCAGAGGKTLALAATMQNKGVLTSGDIIEPKTIELKKRLRRAGVDNVQTQVWPLETRNTWVKRHKGSQDVVLLDVPCSGSGVWRRNPDAKWVLNPERLAELCEIQQSILQQTADLVKVGGRLVYATCSVFGIENEDQIEAFLADRKDFKLVPISTVWAEAAEAGTVHGPCPAAADATTLRLAPHTTETDGFFVAVLERLNADSADA